MLPSINATFLLKGTALRCGFFSRAHVYKQTSIIFDVSIYSVCIFGNFYTPMSRCVDFFGSSELLPV